MSTASCSTLANHTAYQEAAKECPEVQSAAKDQTSFEEMTSAKLIGKAMLLMDDLVVSESDQKKSNKKGDDKDKESNVPPRTLKELVAYRGAGKVRAHHMYLTKSMYDTPDHS